MLVALKHFWMSGVWSRPPVAQIVEVSDSTKSVDYISFSSSFIRGFFDSSKMIDWYGSTAYFVRSLADSGKATDALAKNVNKAYSDTYEAVDYVSKFLVKSLVDYGKAVDVLAKSVDKVYADAYRVVDYVSKSTIKSLADSLKMVDWFEKAVVPRVSYTLRYGLTYKEWAEEKAKRIRDCLILFYVKGAPVNLQVLAERVYRERLKDVSKLFWMPVQDRFTDFKPSPFIKNFLAYLIDTLVAQGYIIHGWIVEVYDRFRVFDVSFDASMVRMYGVGLFRKFVEAADEVRVSDVRVDAVPPSVKIRRFVRQTIVEVRDFTCVSEPVKPEVDVEPPAAKSSYVNRVLRVPSFEYLIDVCTWKDA